jgi:hypothetical protein
MRPFLALVGGFVLSLGMFAFGAGFATWLLMAEPVQQLGPAVDVAGLWTQQPRRIDAAAQDLTRVPGPAAPREATPSEESEPVRAKTAGEVAPEVDDAVVTGSVERAAGAERLVPELSAAHVEWCADRYRSYRVSDDTYAPYSGGRRPCASPFSGETEASLSDSVIYAEEAEDASASSVDWISAEAAEGDGLGSGHVADCYSRYRSYRPEDNTYQPYGGGPRRQCR